MQKWEVTLDGAYSLICFLSDSELVLLAASLHFIHHTSSCQNLGLVISHCNLYKNELLLTLDGLLVMIHARNTVENWSAKYYRSIKTWCLMEAWSRFMVLCLWLTALLKVFLPHFLFLIGWHYWLLTIDSALFRNEIWGGHGKIVDDIGI